MPSSASWLIRGTRPTVETVMPRADMPEAVRRRVGEAAYGADHGLVVGHRLAHAHEDHVGDPARAARDLAARQRPGAGDDLLDDLGGRHVALQAALAGGAERAGHAAAGLAGDAHGGAVGVAHQHRLDERAVEELPQRLAGGAACRPPCVRSGVISVGSSAATSSSRWAAGQVGHLGRVVDEPAEVVGRELLGAEAGQAQLGASTVLAAGLVEVGEVPRRLLAAAGLVEDQGQRLVLRTRGRVGHRVDHPTRAALESDNVRRRA